jgi:hypothetical protein
MAEILIFGFCIVAAGKIFWDLAHLEVENPSGEYREPSRLRKALDWIENPFRGDAMSEEPYIKKQVVTVIRLYNPDYGDKRVCVCGHSYERHFDGYEDPDHQDVGCKYCYCHNFIERTDADSDLRNLVIAEFAGVGACSPEIYAAKLESIALSLDTEVDEDFRLRVSAILATLPCSLD